jgi:uncharacterized protein (TIGR03067 family)
MHMLYLLLPATALLGFADLADDKSSSQAELDKLRGTWLTVSMIANGKTLVDETTAPPPGPVTKFAYEGNKWMVIVDGKTVASGILRVDPTKTPKQIDILDESGVTNGQTKLGIYELNGDTYKYCLGPSGKPRPSEFVSKEGSGDVLGVSRREKP